MKNDENFKYNFRIRYYNYIIFYYIYQRFIYDKVLNVRTRRSSMGRVKRRLNDKRFAISRAPLHNTWTFIYLLCYIRIRTYYTRING